ncbi:hypothetical protein [Alistipes shahii]|uniref:hypothetical protein n=1 Tax=Alistipes shahii TaxID=328814 RepID=UPI002673BAC4|nr:hypothetical protein [Alistipes shahii]
MKKTIPGQSLENLFYLQYDLPSEASFHATTEEAKWPDELYMQKLLPELNRLGLQPRHIVANDEAYYAALKGVTLFTPEAEKLMLTKDYFSARRQIRLCAPDLKRRNEVKRPPRSVLKFY